MTVNFNNSYTNNSTFSPFVKNLTKIGIDPKNGTRITSTNKIEDDINKEKNKLKKRLAIIGITSGSAVSILGASLIILSIPKAKGFIRDLFVKHTRNLNPISDLMINHPKLKNMVMKMRAKIFCGLNNYHTATKSPIKEFLDNIPGFKKFSNAIENAFVFCARKAGERHYTKTTESLKYAKDSTDKLLNHFDKKKVYQIADELEPFIDRNETLYSEKINSLKELLDPIIKENKQTSSSKDKLTETLNALVSDNADIKDRRINRLSDILTPAIKENRQINDSQKTELSSIIKSLVKENKEIKISNLINLIKNSEKMCKNHPNVKVKDFINSVVNEFDFSEQIELLKKDKKLSELASDLETDEKLRKGIVLRFAVTTHKINKIEKVVNKISKEFTTKRIPLEEEGIEEFKREYTSKRDEIINALKNNQGLDKFKDLADFLTRENVSKGIWDNKYGESILTPLFNGMEEVTRPIEYNCAVACKSLKGADEALCNISFSKDADIKMINSFRKAINGTYKELQNYSKLTYEEKTLETKKNIVSNYKNKIQSLKDEIKNYKESINDTDNQWDKILSDLEKADTQIDPNGNDKGYIEDVRNVLKMKIKHPENPNTKEEKGINILKELYQEDYNDLKHSLDSLAANVDKSVTFENEEYNGRRRELALGVGPFEITGPLLSLFLFANEERKAKGKKEHISKALRVGMPIGGGLGVWGLANLYFSNNGFWSIFFGLGSGLAFDRLGAVLDKHVNHYTNPKKAAKALKLKEKNSPSLN